MSVKDIIPAAKRKLVYGWFAIVGLALGAIQVGYSAAEMGSPVWLNVAMSVYVFVGGGIGYVAGANTDDTADDTVEVLE